MAPSHVGCSRPRRSHAAHRHPALQPCPHRRARPAEDRAGRLGRPGDRRPGALRARCRAHLGPRAHPAGFDDSDWIDGRNEGRARNPVQKWLRGLRARAAGLTIDTVVSAVDGRPGIS